MTRKLMMGFDNKELEGRLDQACTLLHSDFFIRFKNDIGYVSPGGAKLEAFITDLQKEFENTTLSFLKEKGLENDTKAKSKALAIAKLCARKCLEGFNKL